MKKPYLMIHEFKEEFFELPLHRYILTFDDGLISPYLYLDKLMKVGTQLIFSISTGIVCEKKQDKDFITAEEARIKAEEDYNYENYLLWDQIKKIRRSRNCMVAGHGHAHVRLKDIKSLTEKVKIIHEDTDRMFQEFWINMNFKPDIFCFPYNYDDKFYKGILKNKYGIKRFLGPERVDIKELVS